MAAPAKMSGVSEESSSEDEHLERFREAAWTFDNSVTTGRKGEGEINGKQSRRVTVSHHEHDGNELQTTPEFRTHVAKKLVNLLDSCISVVLSGASICAEATKVEDKVDNDEGFRLFTSSVPGQSMDEPPAPARRRPIPSSSDSDSEMEMRFKEAAVSVSDLLPPPLPSEPSSKTPCAEKVKRKKKKKQEEEEVEGIKTKKQPPKEQNMELDSQVFFVNAQSKDGNMNLAVDCLLPSNKCKKKKKKKKKQQVTDKPK
ncbi:protein CUSTOS [Aplochiton taeniatus]